MDQEAALGHCSDPRQYTSVITLWGRHREWQKAVELFEEMKAGGIERDAFVFRAAARACLASGQLERGLDIIDELLCTRAAPDTLVYTSLASACLPPAMDTPWMATISSSASAQPTSLQPASMHNSAPKPRAVQAAVALVRRLLSAGLLPANMDALRRIVSASIRTLDVDAALALMRDAEAAGAWPDAKQYSMLLGAWACARWSRGAGSSSSSAAAAHADRGVYLLQQLREARGQPTLHAHLAVAAALTRCGDCSRVEAVVSELIERINDTLRGGAGAEAEPSAVGAAVEHAKAARRASALREEARTIDRSALTAVLAMLHEGELWGRVLELECATRAIGCAPTSRHFSFSLNACEKMGDAPGALRLFDEMGEIDMSPDVYHYCSVIVACGKAGRTSKALELFRSMRPAGVEPNKQVFTGAIQACADGGRWRAALELFLQMEETARTDSSLKPQRVTFNAILDAVAPLYAQSRWQDGSVCAEHTWVNDANGRLRDQAEGAGERHGGMDSGSDHAGRRSQSEAASRHHLPPLAKLLWGQALERNVQPACLLERPPTRTRCSDGNESPLTPPISPRSPAPGCCLGAPGVWTFPQVDPTGWATRSAQFWVWCSRDGGALVAVNTWNTGQCRPCRQRTTRAMRPPSPQLVRRSQRTVRLACLSLVSRLSLACLLPNWQLLLRSERDECMPTLCIITGQGRSRPDHQYRDLRSHVEGLLAVLGVPTFTPLHYKDPRIHDDPDRWFQHHCGVIYLDAQAIALMAKHTPVSAPWLGVGDGYPA